VTTGGAGARSGRERRGPGFAAGDALLVVDVQNDFCAGGSLAVREGDAVVPVLNRWIAAARHAGVPVFAARDWHPADHVSFHARGGPWPPHCVQGTRGAEIHPGLELPAGTPLFSKGDDPDRESYSAFQGTALVDRLRSEGVRRLWVGGLTLDYCVRATTLDAVRHGFAVRVILPATRAVDAVPGDGDRALSDIRACGAAIETDPDPERANHASP
jgi:nicotinamidase/pyrazinamidase